MNLPKRFPFMRSNKQQQVTQNRVWKIGKRDHTMCSSYQIYRVQFIEPNSNVSLNGMRGILIESRCNYIRYSDKRFHVLYTILPRMTS